jgi:gluconate 2-dehydrogenase gamma chain
MNRRDFLQCAAVLVAGTSNVPLGWSLSQEQQTFLAAQPDYIDRHPLTLFSDAQRATVVAIAEQIIPATDTPGATDARVGRFVELMVSNWFNDEERGHFLAGLADLENRSGGNFAALPATEQLAVLETLEAESADNSWYDFANILRVWDDEAPFVCQFKELTVLGFMLSEVGGTRFQQQNPMGAFDGSLRLGKDDPAYGAELPLRQMASEVTL